jgi:hypothetical protein
MSTLTSLWIFAPLWCVAGVAQAAPVASGVADPARGLLQLSTRVDSRVVAVGEVGCEGSGCLGNWHQTDVVGRLNLAPVRGIGLFAEAGRSSSRIKAADYRGDGWLLAAGGSASVQVGVNWWISAHGRVSDLRADGATVESGGQERASHMAATGTLLAAWHTDADELSTWVGMQTDLAGVHDVYPLGGQLDGSGLQISLEPLRRVNGVAGIRLGSPDVTAAWGRAMRLDMGAEVQAGQEYGASFWAGFHI